MEQRKSNKDVKGWTQAGKTPVRSETDALFDGGFTRSSKDISVMEMERRCEVIQLSFDFPPGSDGESRRELKQAKVLPISKRMVWQAYKQVKSNKGCAGVDGESLSKFSENLKDNLYQLWRRLVSGSYFPEAVLCKRIKKSNGKSRPLGIPTVRDRIAQQVLKDLLEPQIDNSFDANSYGYRTGLSAHDALKAVSKGVQECAWVIDLDISNFFEELCHQLLNRALVLHVEADWILTYLNRFINAPIEEEGGEQRYRNGKGTPQGGVISPLLSNLYLHYALDKWLRKIKGKSKFVRYADDIIIHCSSKIEADDLLGSIKARLLDCGLQVNESKSGIVYCKSERRRANHNRVKFDFLGYSFQPRTCKGGEELFLGYCCAISRKSEQKIVLELRRSKFHMWTGRTIEELAKHFNSKLRGWINYYGKYRRRNLQRIFSIFNDRLIKWACRKYKRLDKSYRKGSRWLRNLARKCPNLFYHWECGFASS